MRDFVIGALALVALGACAQQAPAEMTQAQLVARGEYLVNNIGGCNDCHTPMTPQGPDVTQALQGGTLIFAPTIPMPWAPVAPPLAGIPTHYTEEQFAAFLQTGVRPDGSRPLPPMPAFRLNPEDARAMTAYIATLPSADETAPQTPPSE
ncbi:MAG: c-type cytochrome [Hyphomonadaceae bacterium JAD_PAG50586_4]|nr:MAG: c-type cytochrome [Hyphomonadaceae bacterium JAD_PAG50586_4]